MGILIRMLAVFAAIMGMLFAMGAAHAKSRPECRPGYERVEREYAPGVKIIICRTLPMTCEWRDLPDGGREKVCYRIRPVAPKRVKASEISAVFKPSGENKSADELLAELSSHQDEAKPPKKRPLTPEQELLLQVVSSR